MNTRVISHLAGVIAAPRTRVLALVANWIGSLNKRIDADPMPRRHRMGAWEAGVSLRARAALDATREEGES